MNADPKLRFSSPSGLPPPMGYSHVAEVTRGRLVYISGQVPMDAAGQLVAGDDFKAQVEQVFANLGRALESVGASFRDVVKLTYFCVERVPPEAIATVREVRDRHVDVNAPPASSFVVVSRLVRPEWLIEIEAVAALGA